MTNDDEHAGSGVPLPLPTTQQFAFLGLHDVAELHGGHQARIVRARLGADPVVVKLTDAQLVDAGLHAARVEIATDLASIDDLVIGPLRLGSERVQVMGGWLAVAYPYVAGRAADPAFRSDVERMARALAALHASMRRLAPVDLPVVTALRAAGSSSGADPSRYQLLHGDYSPANVRIDSDRVAVLDLDDCGLGPVEHEIGNTLYSVLFDATLGGDLPLHQRFRAWFTEAYAAETSTVWDDDRLDAEIEQRRGALRHWLDHLDEAPIGIRTSSPSWQARLRSFAHAP